MIKAEATHLRKSLKLSLRRTHKVAPLLPGKASDPGATARDNRLFLEAVLWRVRTGAPWRDLPGDFGRWTSVFQRFRRWVKGRVFERVFACLSGTFNTPYGMSKNLKPRRHSRLQPHI